MVWPSRLVLQKNALGYAFHRPQRGTWGYRPIFFWKSVFEKHPTPQSYKQFRIRAIINPSTCVVKCENKFCLYFKQQSEYLCNYWHQCFCKCINKHIFWHTMQSEFTELKFSTFFQMKRRLFVCVLTHYYFSSALNVSTTIMPNGFYEGITPSETGVAE